MSKFQFKFIQLPGTRGSNIDTERVENQLNVLGSQGWWALPFKVSDSHLLLMRDAPEPDPDPEFELEETHWDKVQRIRKEVQVKWEAKRQAEESADSAENTSASNDEAEVDEFNGAIINAS